MNIICSIGPQNNNIEIITKLAKEGMNIARLNFSHINKNEAEALITEIRNTNLNVKILQDLQGNKLRVSNKFQGEVNIKKGDIVYFCSDNKFAELTDFLNNTDDFSTYYILPINFKYNYEKLMSVNKISMKDGSMHFQILEKGEYFIKTISGNKGVIRKEKSMDFSGIDRTSLTLTVKDKEDILWGLNHKVDMMCLSYCDTKEIVMEFKNFIFNNLEEGQKPPIIVAKIESAEGIKNYNKILCEVDGIMLGRGDLVSEFNLLEICKIEQELIKKANDKSKFFIIATYVLSSMKNSLYPNISELIAIYNELKYGEIDYMLSTEVSIGNYPLEVVKTLKQMINKYKP